jgi:hypothetical protein
MYIRQIALILLLLLSQATQVFAEEKQWSFIFVASGIDKYRVSEGKASVSIKNKKIEADLTDEKGVQYKIKGTIIDHKITAKFSVMGSDYFVDSPISGTFITKKWTEKLGDSVGRESISLNDGWNFIGLTREIIEQK